MSNKLFIPTTQQTRGRGAPITLSQRRFNAFGGYPTIFMGTVFAFAGTAFGQLTSHRLYTSLFSVTSLRQLVRNTVYLSGPTAVGVAIGVNMFGNPYELACLIRDGEKCVIELEELKQELYLPCTN